MNLATLFARIAQIAAALAVLALLVLHLVRPELAPADHMISEYAVGSYGWVMTLSFVGFAVASFALLGAAASHVKTWPGRIGLVFLALAGVGSLIGGIFAIDPTTTDPEKMSFSGHMHGVGFMIGVPSELLTVLLLSIAARKVEAWSAPKLAVLAGLVWASLGVMIPLLIAGHGFGLPNRTFMVFYAGFLFAAARPLADRIGISPRGSSLVAGVVSRSS
ncbi:MAG: DUF998 domain-containing protein [Polyangiaceae bacterium]